MMWDIRDDNGQEKQERLGRDQETERALLMEDSGAEEGLWGEVCSEQARWWDTPWGGQSPSSSARGHLQDPSGHPSSHA